MARPPIRYPTPEQLRRRIANRNNKLNRAALDPSAFLYAQEVLELAAYLRLPIGTRDAWAKGFRELVDQVRPFDPDKNQQIIPGTEGQK